jgi:DNA-directed RNA polymerase subunit alpha
MLEIPLRAPNLLVSVNDVGFSRRVVNRLFSAGIQTLKDLVIRTEDELLHCRHLGTSALQEIREKLAGLGLSLREVDYRAADSRY